MTILRAVTVNVEAAHYDAHGRMHGHSYLIECWTADQVDMPEFERLARSVASKVDHTVLDASIGSPTMEALGQWFVAELSLARAVVRRPTLGYAVEVGAVVGVAGT